MFAVTLCSGSAGNAVLIAGAGFSEHAAGVSEREAGAGHEAGHGDYVLVDAGLSYRRLTHALRQFSLSPAQLTAVLITHEHSDHVSGLRTLYAKTGVTVYASSGTANALQKSMPGLAVRAFTAGDSFAAGCLKVQSFSTPHDAADSVGYVVQAGRLRAAVCTDLGHMPDKALDILCGADYLVLEANHDVDMLKWGPYPAYLKRRILGPYGHLSNEACAEAAYTCARFGAKRITLAHLSEENNALDVALGTVRHRLRDLRVIVDAAPRFEPGEVFWAST